MLDSKKEFIKEINNRLGSKRFEHTVGVVEAALKLAEDKAVSVNKVEKAAFLHDIAKNKTPGEMQKIITESDWEVDKLEMSIPAVLHAPAGAIISEKEFGITDEEILEAIRFHTLGHPDMSLTALIIFAADFIEPNRNFPGLEKIREIIFEDFTKGIVEICSSMIQHQLETAKIIHPNTVMLRNRFLLY